MSLTVGIAASNVTSHARHIHSALSSSVSGSQHAVARAPTCPDLAIRAVMVHTASNVWSARILGYGIKGESAGSPNMKVDRIGALDNSYVCTRCLRGRHLANGFNYVLYCILYISEERRARRLHLRAASSFRKRASLFSCYTQVYR